MRRPGLLCRAASRSRPPGSSMAAPAARRVSVEAQLCPQGWLVLPPSATRLIISPRSRWRLQLHHWDGKPAQQHQAELNDYLQSKSINQLFIQIVEALLIEKPDNPIGFTVQFLQKKFPEQAAVAGAADRHDCWVPALGYSCSRGPSGRVDRREILSYYDHCWAIIPPLIPEGVRLA